MSQADGRPSPSRSLFHSDKGDLHVPGAGTCGMFVLIVSLSMLFAATLTLFVVYRLQVPIGQWRPTGFTHFPPTLWFSTVLLISCSVTIHTALRAIRNDREAALRRWLAATLVLGGAFLLLQSYNWLEIWRTILPDERHYKFMATFYLLTGLHAAHVLGGLIPLGIVLSRVAQHRYSRNFHPGVRYCTIYWHFLDAAWVVIFGLLLAGS